MEIGDRVRITAGKYTGQVGTVHKITKAFVRVRGILPKGLIHMPPRYLEAVADEAPQAAGIMSIGGIGIYAENETPIIPSIAAIERVERMTRTDTICRRCGESENFDGARFSTDPSSGLCDDCL